MLFLTRRDNILPKTKLSQPLIVVYSDPGNRITMVFWVIRSHVVIHSLVNYVNYSGVSEVFDHLRFTA